MDGLTLAKGCKLHGLTPELQKEFEQRMAEIEAQEYSMVQK